jgi:hypothetical protein
MRLSLKKVLHKKGLAEWLKVALSSNPRTTKKRKKERRFGGGEEKTFQF